MISIPNQDISLLASTNGSIDLGGKFGIADNKTYTFSGSLSAGTASNDRAYKITITISNVSMSTRLDYSISSNYYAVGNNNLGLSIVIPCSIS